MNVVPTRIPDVLLIGPKVFSDERGSFFESYNRRAFAEAAGLDVEFVQDNHSRSSRNVLRGLHYQIRQPQLLRKPPRENLRRKRTRRPGKPSLMSCSCSTCTSR